jgi:hypothetical protein
MSDPIDEAKRSPWWRKLLFILAGLIAASAAKVAVEAAFKQFNKPSKAQLEKALDNYANNTEGGALLKELQRSFPDDYAAMKSRLADLTISGAKSADVQSNAAKETETFLRRHLHHTVKAPSEHLLAIGRANANFMNSIKTDSLQACADYGTKGTMDFKSLSPRSMNSLSLLGAAQVRAARAGMDNPVQHEEEFSGADSEKLYEVLKQQSLSDDTLSSLSSEEGLEKLPTEEQCSVSSAMLNGIMDLPPDTSVKLIISLLKEGR